MKNFIFALIILVCTIFIFKLLKHKFNTKYNNFLTLNLLFMLIACILCKNFKKSINNFNSSLKNCININNIKLGTKQFLENKYGFSCLLSLLILMILYSLSNISFFYKLNNSAIYFISIFLSLFLFLLSCIKYCYPDILSNFILNMGIKLESSVLILLLILSLFFIISLSTVSIVSKLIKTGYISIIMIFITFIIFGLFIIFLIVYWIKYKNNPLKCIGLTIITYFLIIINASLPLGTIYVISSYSNDQLLRLRENLYELSICCIQKGMFNFFNYPQQNEYKKELTIYINSIQKKLLSPSNNMQLSSNEKSTKNSNLNPYSNINTSYNTQLSIPIDKSIETLNKIDYLLNDIDYNAYLSLKASLEKISKEDNKEHINYELNSIEKYYLSRLKLFRQLTLAMYFQYFIGKFMEWIIFSYITANLYDYIKSKSSNDDTKRIKQELNLLRIENKKLKIKLKKY